MKQPLGAKKTRRIQALTGKGVRIAYTRGSWTHFVAQVYFTDGTIGWVNYKTGEVEMTDQRWTQSSNEAER